jgi:predicted RNase H-like HicB family nuclease
VAYSLVRRAVRDSYQDHQRQQVLDAKGRVIAACAADVARFGLVGPCENEFVDKYAVVVHQEPEGGFWAEVPALPGCYSEGETVEELMGNIREAISGVLEVMKANGARPESNVQILELAL